MRHLAPLFALALVACASDPGVMVLGDVSVDVDGTPTGFSFVQTTTLLDPDFADPEDTRLRGTCRISEDANGLETIAVSIERAPRPRTGVEIERFFTRVGPDGGHVEARLGEERFVGGGEDCQLSVVRRAGTSVDLSALCALEGTSGAMASLDADITFSRCVTD